MPERGGSSGAPETPTEFLTRTMIGTLEGCKNLLAGIEARDRRIADAWTALREAGFYGHDSSTLADGIRWLAQKSQAK